MTVSDCVSLSPSHLWVHRCLLRSNCVSILLHCTDIGFQGSRSVVTYFDDERRSMDRESWTPAAQNAWNWKEHCTTDEQTRPGHVERVVVAARYVEQPAWNTHAHTIPTQCCTTMAITAGARERNGQVRAVFPSTVRLVGQTMHFVLSFACSRLWRYINFVLSKHSTK